MFKIFEALDTFLKATLAGIVALFGFAFAFGILWLFLGAIFGG